MAGKRSLAERQHLRQHYLDQAVATARLQGLTMRCRDAVQFRYGPEVHRLCLGESSGGGGCLCTCHDATIGAEVIEMTVENGNPLVEGQGVPEATDAEQLAVEEDTVADDTSGDDDSPATDTDAPL